MTSRSYFGKMNSTLGFVVPLAMFKYRIQYQGPLLTRKYKNISHIQLVAFNKKPTAPTDKRRKNVDISCEQLGGVLDKEGTSNKHHHPLTQQGIGKKSEWAGEQLGGAQ